MKADEIGERQLKLDDFTFDIPEVTTTIEVDYSKLSDEELRIELINLFMKEDELNQRLAHICGNIRAYSNEELEKFRIDFEKHQEKFRKINQEMNKRSELIRVDIKRNDFGESKSVDIGKYLTIEVGALEGQKPGFSIEEEGNINISLIDINTARVSFDVHNANRSSGLRLDVDLGKGIFEFGANKNFVFKFYAEADIIRVTGSRYYIVDNKIMSLNIHAETGAFGGGFEFGKDGIGFSSPKAGYGWGFDYQVNTLK